MEVKRSLHEAAILGDVVLLDQVLERDPLILHRISVGSLVHTPLHVAAFRGHLEFVQKLLSKNQDLACVLDQRRWSALHLAAARGHRSIVRELIQANPDMCTTLDADGRNPLHLATIKGDVDVLIELFEAQPQRISELLSTRDNNDDTLLHLAIKNLQSETLERFLHTKEAMEAKPTKKRGFMPLDILNNEQALNSEQALNTINKCGFTPLDILEQTDRNEHKIEYTLRAAGCLKATEINQGGWLSKQREGLMVVASLIATMTFQAALSPPGGYWQDNNEEHKAGESVMASNRPSMYSRFLIANSCGFFGSIMATLILATGGASENNVLRSVLAVFMLEMGASSVFAYALSILATSSKKDWQRTYVVPVLIFWGTWSATVLVVLTVRITSSGYAPLLTWIKTLNARRQRRR